MLRYYGNLNCRSVLFCRYFAETGKKMSQSVKKIWNIISTVLVVLVVVLALLLVGARLIGLKTYSVLSGSMEPTYHTGALIYVKQVDTSTLQAGDPVTFMLNEDTVATHRIIEVIPDETDPSVIRFRTQGDANDTPDGTPVHYKNVIGKPVFTIPYLGYVSAFVQDKTGRFVAISLAGLLLVLTFLPDILSDDKNTKKAAKGKEEQADTD